MRAVFVILLLAGCAPRLVVATPSGGIIDRQGEMLGLQQGFLLAERHCRQYGKVVRIVPNQTSQYATSFACADLRPGSVG